MGSVSFPSTFRNSPLTVAVNFGTVADSTTRIHGLNGIEA